MSGKTVIIDANVHKVLKAAAGIHGFSIGDFVSQAIKQQLALEYKKDEVIQKMLISPVADNMEV